MKTTPNNILVLFVSLLAGFGLFFNEDVNAADYSNNQIFTISFDTNDLWIDKIDQYSVIGLSDLDYLSASGKPLLPKRRIRYALPDGKKVENIKILNSTIEVIPGEYSIYPAQPPISLSSDINNIDFIDPDSIIYNSSQPYPDEPFRLIRQADLAGLSYIDIEIYPIQYIPSEKRLLLYKSITLQIEGSDGYLCGDYLPQNISNEAKEMYMNRLNETVYNKNDIVLSSYSYDRKGFGPLPDGGPYDYVIITSDVMADCYEPLIHWRTRTGMKATVMINDEIYTNYEGAGNQEKIRNFIIDAHQSWGTMYFMLAGDENTIPFEYRTYWNENVPSDMYYGDYDDDWEYEVYIGRITAEDTTRARRFVDKVISYETNLPSEDYHISVTLFGMDIVLPESPPVVYPMGEMIKDSIDINILPFYLNVTKIYDDDPTPNHHDAFVDAINTGQNIFNHAEHGGNNNLATGWDQHALMFFDYEIYDLTNYHRYFNMFTVGCNTCHLDMMTDLISESFIMYTDSTGAVSWTGNMRTGWAGSITDVIDNTLALDYYWHMGLFNLDAYRAGEALAYSKSLSPTDVDCPYCEWELILVGDPALSFWTDTPDELIVSYPTEIEAVQGEFPVHVETSGGLKVADAYVCLWNETQSYATGYTDINGDAIIDFYPTNENPVLVTVTKQNTLPFLGETQVIGNIPPQCITPGDTIIFLCTPGEISITVGCFDVDGNLASGPDLIYGPGEISDNEWSYYAIEEDSLAITVRCTDSLGYFLDETVIVLIDFNNPPQFTAPEDTSFTDDWPVPEVVLPLIIIDENPAGGLVLDGPGYIEDGCWKFTPASNINTDITIQVIDSCGLTADDSFHFTCFVENICGDVNGDNAVNLFDIVAMIQHIYLGADPPDPYYVGNVDGSGAMSIYDITYLITFLYRDGPAPHCGLL